MSRLANFGGHVLTRAGQNLLAKLAATSGKLNYSSIKFGDGVLGSTLPTELTALISTKGSVQPSRIVQRTAGGRWNVTGVLDNSAITTGFYLREWGIFARDPDTSAEVLLLYANAGSTAEYIPAYAGGDTTTHIQKEMTAACIVSGEVTVNTQISSELYVTQSDFVSHVQNNDIHVTGEQKTVWNQAAVAVATAQTTADTALANAATAQTAAVNAGTAAAAAQTTADTALANATTAQTTADNAAAVASAAQQTANDKANAKHTHGVADITNFPASLPANGGNADTVGGVPPYNLMTLNAQGEPNDTQFPLYCKWFADLGVYKLLIDPTIAGEYYTWSMFSNMLLCSVVADLQSIPTSVQHFGYNGGAANAPSTAAGYGLQLNTGGSAPNKFILACDTFGLYAQAYNGADNVWSGWKKITTFFTV